MNLTDYYDKFDDKEQEAMVQMWNGVKGGRQITVGTLPFVDLYMMVYVLRDITEWEEHYRSISKNSSTRKRHERNKKASMYLLRKLVNVADFSDYIEPNMDDKELLSRLGFVEKELQRNDILFHTDTVLPIMMGDEYEPI